MLQRIKAIAVAAKMIGADEGRFFRAEQYRKARRRCGDKSIWQTLFTDPTAAWINVSAVLTGRQQQHRALVGRYGMFERW